MTTNAQQTNGGERRIFGTEVEYGILSPEDPTASPIVTSTQAVLAYAKAHEGGLDRRTRWDYAPESPLRDSRGFDLRRYHQTPIIDPNAVGAANLLLRNGARFYVDHAHPEYSAPETTSAWDAVIADRAGDHIMLEAAKLAAQEIDDEGNPGPVLKIYRNNVDGKGASYGTHENYLFRRETDFANIVVGLTPFFVTRQIFTGAGRVGLGQRGQEAGFQVSQRADYIETEVSLETTLNRGIINTRDEPHANPDKWRRLHVIIGDANMSEYATFLKLGTTALVLDAIEDGVDFSDLALREPVAEVHRVSHDLTCTNKLELADHTTHLTAIDIQREYLRRVSVYDTEGTVVKLWAQVLDLLADDPLKTSHLLDWTAKLKLMEGLRSRAGLGWDHPKLALIDFQYSDIDPARGLYHALVRRGAMQTLVPEEDVLHAVTHAPTTTRAYLRGGLLRRFSDDIVAASWESAVVDRSGTYKQSGDINDADLVRLSFSEVDGLHEDEVGDIMESASGISDLVDVLSERGLAGLGAQE
ncbi:depupylase/deamidase Dop [Corynebacterium sp. H78]|uniref:depupylase/deamidase Dop n=1 Tax=Corynebacterium sp. H78 TaxID=3133417 RepID=UPI0030A8A06C